LLEALEAEKALKLSFKLAKQAVHHKTGTCGVVDMIGPANGRRGPRLVINRVQLSRPTDNASLVMLSVLAEPGLVLLVRLGDISFYSIDGMLGFKCRFRSEGMEIMPVWSLKCKCSR
jgi:hypothetical protein